MWPTIPSNQPDVRVVTGLERLQWICLCVIIPFSAITVCAWVLSPLGHTLPRALAEMRVNTAFLTLLCSLAFALSLPRRSAKSNLASRLLAAFIVVFALLLLASDFGWIGTGINTLFAPSASDPFNHTPGRVSPEACFAFVMLGLILAGLRARKSFFSHFIDLVTLVLCLTMLTFLARFVFGLSHIFNSSPRDPFSVQSFVALCLLTVVAGTRRAEYGLHSVLLSDGIGGKSARIAAPCAILLPFVFAAAKVMLVNYKIVADSTATAASTSLLAIIALCLILALAVRTDDLERATRELSLRDELTHLYNRRGFYVLAEQALRFARRAGESFFVLFIDVDGLKRTNDALGHEAGSELLAEMAALIGQTFRETDVIGRIGGDEFVVAGQANAERISTAVQRLEEAVIAANQRHSRVYILNFSLGYVLSSPAGQENLDQLLEQADHIMYQAKRDKNRGRGATKIPDEDEQSALGGTEKLPDVETSVIP